MFWQIAGFILFLSSLVSVLIAAYAWRHQEATGARQISFLMLAFAVWAAGEALIVLSHDLNMILWLIKIQYLGIVSAPIFWLLFAITYTRHQDWLNRSRILFLFLIPGLILLAVWTLDLHSLYYQSYSLTTVDDVLVFVSEPAIIYWVNLFYSYSIFALGMALIIRQFFTTPRQYSGQIGMIIAGAVIPMIGNFVYNFGQGRSLGIDLTPLFFSMTGVMISWSVFRYQFLAITPVAREWVVENLHDGVMVLDLNNRIIDTNQAMKDFIGLPADRIHGNSINDVFSQRPDLVEKIFTNNQVLTEVIVDGEDKRSDYELQISPIFDATQHEIGRLVILRDITHRRQAVTELNRYAEQNAQLLAEELRQRQLAESLRQTMMIISSSLKRDEIVNEILAQLRKVLPYYSAALYLFDGDELQLEQLVGPETISNKAYTTPRRHDQIQKIFQLKKAEVFMSAYSNYSESQGDPVYSSMAAPLVVGQEALGVLTIDRFETAPFTEENAEILQAFTNQAAIAIKNADYFQRAADAAVLEERNRLAQDLHDAVNQTLFTASIMAEALPQVWESDPEQGKQGLYEIRQLTRAALSEMRTLLMELHPQRITEKTLGDLLDHLTRTVANRLRIPVDLEILNDTILPAEVQVTYYRVAQEAFNNIMKHALASQANVSVDAQSQRAILTIRDNGKGFDLEDERPGHMGVGIMQERAKRIGAKLSIDSQTHQGTEIRLVWQNNKTNNL